MWLQVRSGPDAGRSVELPRVAGRPFVIGRQHGVDWVVRDERASRRHVQFVAREDGLVELRDLGSANGTWLDGERVHEALLRGGEEVRIGDVALAVLTEAPSRPGEDPVGGARGAAHASPSVTAAPTAAEAAPRVATVSMVGRLLDRRERHTRRWAIGAIVAAVAIAGAAVLLVRGGGDDRVPDVVAGMEPSTVRVQAARDAGSGWVLDARAGLVVTNAHVVNGGAPYGVVVAGRGPEEGEAGLAAPANRARAATLAGVAPCEDLAVLRLEDADALRSAPLGGRPRRGETVVALGFPASAGALSSTTGVVSASGVPFEDPAPDVPAYPDAILTDTALNPGNSGGPLVDLDGRVVGINSAARTTGSDGRPLQGQNYAIAMPHARPVLEELRRGRSRGWLGVSFTYVSDRDLEARRLPPGLAVASIAPGAPAQDALAPGDLIIGVNGSPLRATLASWCDAAADLRSGEVARLRVIRPSQGRRAATVRVRLP